MLNNLYNQDIFAADVFYYRTANNRKQVWLAKKISSKKRKYTQTEISSALNGMDLILLKLKLPENV